RFLDELRVKSPPDLTSAKNELGALKEADGFYKSLFANFKANAIHDAPPAPIAPVATAEGFLSKLLGADAGILPKDPGPSPVEKSFRTVLLFGGLLDAEKDKGGDGPSKLEKYLLILNKLKAALDSTKPTGSDAQTQTQFAEAATGVDALLDGIE